MNEIKFNNIRNTYTPWVLPSVTSSTGRSVHTGKIYIKFFLNIYNNCRFKNEQSKNQT